MADLTPGETATGIVGLATSIAVSVAGALRFNSRTAKLEDSLKELQEEFAEYKKGSETEVKALRSELAELKGQVVNVGRVSMVDLKPTVAVVVAEEMRSFEERHTERVLSLREDIVDMRGSLPGRAPNTRRRT